MIYFVPEKNVEAGYLLHISNATLEIKK